MKRLLKYGIILSICVLGTIAYIKNDQPKEENKKTVTNYQTVVFKDDHDTLVPIEVDFGRELEDDARYQNMLEVMKSTDYEYLGLHPILDSNLQVNAISMNDKALTFDLSDNLYVANNQAALDIMEMFSYVFCHDSIEKINLKIDGKDVDVLANSTIPTSCMTNRLGINNFEATTNYLYKTTPVVVYNEQTINNRQYYVPVTKRIETTDNDLDTQVSLMLSQLESDKNLSLDEQCSLKDGMLTIHLGASVLNDNETIDNVLYNRIIKSAGHLDDVSKVTLVVDGQEIAPVEDVNGEVDNRIKL